MKEHVWRSNWNCIKAVFVLQLAQFCDNLSTCVLIWSRHCTQLLTCTFLLSHAGKVWAPSVSKHPCVQLESSLYKRHPSASLEWFLFAVHLSSAGHRIFFFFLSISLSLCGQFWSSKRNMKNTGSEMSLVFFHWNTIKLLMSSWSLCFCRFPLFCQYLLLQILQVQKSFKAMSRYS